MQAEELVGNPSAPEPGGSFCLLVVIALLLTRKNETYRFPMQQPLKIDFPIDTIPESVSKLSLFVCLCQVQTGQPITVLRILAHEHQE
jgi:hypothetical protein